MRVLRSASSSVYANLAWEEWLLDRFEVEGPALFFYVNAPSVVLGKNQNPWRETDPLAAQRDGVPVARRISGGGTVYHDTGNLNYSLILSRHEYRQESVFRQVIAALLGLGIKAELLPGNGLGVAGRKFSGSAFCYRGAAVLHHGTVLIQSELDRLRRHMKPALPDIQTRAIASKPASVVNLAELKPRLTIAVVQDALIHEFSPGAPVQEGDPPMQEPDWQQRWERHQSWDWCLGYTPGFSWTESTPDASLEIHVEHGVVQRAEIRRGEALHLVPGLAGCPFSAHDLAETMAEESPGEQALIRRLMTRAF